MIRHTMCKVAHEIQHSLVVTVSYVSINSLSIIIIVENYSYHTYHYYHDVRARTNIINTWFGYNGDILSHNNTILQRRPFVFVLFREFVKLILGRIVLWCWSRSCERKICVQDRPSHSSWCRIYSASFLAFVNF